MVMGLVATKRVMRFRSAFMVLALYPASLMLVYVRTASCPASQQAGKWAVTDL